MISFDEAYRTVLEHKGDFGSETILLERAIGRVLAEDWLADRPLPPYDRVTMDGIAFNAKGIGEERRLPVEGIAAAGDVQKKLMDSGACLEVMTGSILPQGVDTVVRYEDLEMQDGFAHIQAAFKPGQNIHRLGQDREQGELLVPAGTVISAAEIGVAATIGKSQIKVARLPRTMVISTGDELVEIQQKPAAHQIRRSNVYRIAATLADAGVPVDTDHLQDDYEQILKRLKKYLFHYDAIVLSGGVSKGKFDFLPKALEELQVQKHFHKVAQRPGKPLWFGTHQSGCTIFALPGNPISSFMCTHIYYMDWLRVSVGQEPGQRILARLDSDVHFAPDLTFFMEVKLSVSDSGEFTATPMRGNGSGDLANLVKADGFLKIPQGKSGFKQGESYAFYAYRDIY